MKNIAAQMVNFDCEQMRRIANNMPEQYDEKPQVQQVAHDAPRDKCTLSCAINGIHAAFHYLKKNYISGCVMTVPTG